MSPHVGFRQFHSDSKYTDSEYNSGDLKSDSIHNFTWPSTPASRVENVSTIGSYNDTKDKG